MTTKVREVLTADRLGPDRGNVLNICGENICRPSTLLELRGSAPNPTKREEKAGSCCDSLNQHSEHFLEKDRFDLTFYRHDDPSANDHVVL